MKTPTLGYLGPEGTHTHAAAQMLVSNYAASYAASKAVKLVCYPDIPGIMEAVADGSLEQGIVPAENSIEGTVNLTLDILAQELDLYLQGELVLDITHHLLTFMANLGEIHTVMSHPQALAQCRNFLKKHLPQVTIRRTESTAEAVRLLTAPNQTGVAAIGSLASHLHYQVPIKCENIGDFPHNQTRFFIIGRNPFSLSAPTEKTSFVVFPRNNRPGQLYDILRVFAKYEVNLCKVESRPSKKALGSYLFWIDCELGHDHPKLPAIFHDLKKETNYYKFLGSYPIYH